MNRKTQEAIRLIKDNCCVFCGTPTNEDLRKWFGKGGAGGAGGGGWDRYSSTGKRSCMVDPQCYDHTYSNFIFPKAG